MEYFETVEKMLINQGAKNTKPVSATLELTPLCNMNCDMCYIHINKAEMLKQGALLEFAKWQEIIKQMAVAGVLFITITGGEPLLHPDFKEIYLALKKMGMIVTVNTNGTLIDETWADFFEQHPPRRINITVYGSSETTYEKLCHFKGYQKTVAAIKLLLARKIKVKMNGSVTKANLDDFDAIYQLANDLKIPIHMDTNMLPGLKDQFKPFDQQARLNSQDAARVHLKVLQNEMESDQFDSYVKQMIQTVETKTTHSRQITCQAACSSFAINWQGCMRPCVSLSNPSIPVLKEGLEQSWNQLVALSKELLVNEKCSSCKLRPICNTCVATAKWETGAYADIPEYNCIYAKEMYRLLKEIVNENK